jgi:hypothetical protein
VNGLGLVGALVGLARQILAIDWAARRKARRAARAERKKAADHQAMLDHVQSVLDKLPAAKAKRK